MAEARELTDLDIESLEDAKQAARALIKQGARNVLLKLEQGGCLVADEVSLAAAAVAVTHFGAAPSYPSRESLEACIEHVDVRS